MSDLKRPVKVLFCTNRRFGADTPSCATRGNEKIMGAVREEFLRRGQQPPCPIEQVICLGQCNKGPAVRMVPGGEFYLGAKINEVSKLADWIDAQVKEICKEPQTAQTTLQTSSNAGLGPRG